MVHAGGLGPWVVVLALPSDSGGKSVTLLTLAGSVPVTVDGEEYDVPLTVWLTDSYPHRPPPVYVTPGPGAEGQRRDTFAMSWVAP
jgi:hypothetical protein